MMLSDTDLELLAGFREHDPNNDYLGATDFDESMDCDWEESECPQCGRSMDKHDSVRLTRCASAGFTS